MIFGRWKENLKPFFVPFPAIKVRGYTRYRFLELQNGVLKMRHSPENNIVYTHAYVQRGYKQSVDHTYKMLVDQCIV